MSKDRRRGPGEGYVSDQPRADGRFTCKLFIGYGPDGKPQYWQGYGKTKKEAREKLNQARADKLADKPLVPGRQTVAEYLDYWLENFIKPPLRRPLTYKGYKTIVETHLKPAIGRCNLKKLTPRDVQSLISAKTAAGLAPRTIEHIIACLHSALDQAVVWEMATKNVADSVRKPPQKAPKKSALTPAQAKAFLAAIRGDRLEYLYTVAVGLGLRQGEALGLRWQDVDLEAGTLSVSGQLQRIDQEYRLTPAKTEESQAILPLPEFVRQALVSQRELQTAERLVRGSEWANPWGLVFTLADGRPINGSALTHKLGRTLAALELPGVTFHGLRHTCGSLLAEMGVPLPTIRDILRHTQLSTTEIYLHSSAPYTREALDKLDRLLRPE